MSFLDWLRPDDDDILAYEVCNTYAPEPQNIPGDYYVASRISIRGCKEGKKGGLNANFVNHALAYKPLILKRKNREKHRPLCSFSTTKNIGDWYSSNTPATCADCLQIIAAHGLKQAILAQTGAWELP